MCLAIVVVVVVVSGRGGTPATCLLCLEGSIEAGLAAGATSNGLLDAPTLHAPVLKPNLLV